MALSGTLYFIGLITGAMTAGFPADYFGRKPVLIFFITIGGVSNLIGGLVSTFPLYVFFRILAGIGEEGLTILTCTMSVEMVGAKYQSVVGNVNQIFFALGTGIVSSIPYSCVYVLKILSQRIFFLKASNSVHGTESKIDS